MLVKSVKIIGHIWKLEHNWISLCLLRHTVMKTYSYENIFACSYRKLEVGTYGEDCQWNSWDLCYLWDYSLKGRCVVVWWGFENQEEVFLRYLKSQIIPFRKPFNVYKVIHAVWAIICVIKCKVKMFIL